MIIVSNEIFTPNYEDQAVPYYLDCNDLVLHSLLINLKYMYGP
jgi:hypothetical protein